MFKAESISGRVFRGMNCDPGTKTVWLYHRKNLIPSSQHVYIKVEKRHLQ